MGRAGTYEMQPSGYRAFVPASFPPLDLSSSDRFQTLLSTADRAMGRLDGIVEVIPDPDRFVRMFVRREAVLSSQIEGTVGSMMDVLEHEAMLHRSEARMDLREIQNHIDAMNYGITRLETLPLSRRLLCEVHKILMTNVRGGESAKTPGEFRTTQNWIGGASPNTARFVPPPPQVVPEAFSHLERFLHAPEPLPPLVKIGLAHAQFETIHPFLDGNGRTGRLLITFWLVEQGILRKPLLYPSLYLKEYRDEYHARLQAIRDDGEWESWLEFFVDGIAQAAKQATTTASNTLKLREADREKINRHLGKRTAKAFQLHDWLFTQPVVTLPLVQAQIGVSQPTASSLVHWLEDLGLLEELTGKERFKVFRYTAYLDLFPGSADRQ